MCGCVYLYVFNVWVEYEGVLMLVSEHIRETTRSFV